MKFSALTCVIVALQSTALFAFAPYSSHPPTKAFLTSVLKLNISDQNKNNNDSVTSDQHEVVEEYRAGLGLRAEASEKLDKPLSVVMKFGGSSLANAERIDHVAQLIKRQIDLGYKVRAVVCSAMGKTTNGLLSAGDFALEGRVNIDALRTLHKQAIDEFGLSDNVRSEVMELLEECESLLNGVKLLQELSPKSLDQLVSYGERCSVRIMSARLNQLGVPAAAYDAWEIGMITDSNFGDALIDKSTPSNIKNFFSSRIDASVTAVVTGFIGHDSQGRITTLGRGGSDLTATSIGAACNLDEIQVWKDVDGILTTDPRVVASAIPVPAVTYDEASELAYFGAQVLHPIAMQPAMKEGVMVRVKNSYNPSAPGTTITQTKEVGENLVTAITFKRNVQLVDIVSTRMLGAYGFLSRVFGAFEKNKISVDVLASSEVSVSVTLDRKSKINEGDEILDDLAPYADVTIKQNRSILTLIADVERSSEVLATVFSSFSKMGIKVQMLSQGASKVNISFVVKDEDLERAVENLHQCFFEGSCIFEPVEV